MSTTTQPDAYKTQIETALQEYCESRREASLKVGTGYGQLWQEIEAYIAGGGKRLRPRIFLMAHDFYGGETSAPVLKAACSWELLHACLLIHDDIIDRDLIRHGKPNIAGRYQKLYEELAGDDTEHYALSAALLAGDLLLSSAYDIILESGLSNDQKVTMQRFIHQAVFTVGGGELIDTEAALYPIDSTDPLVVATHKTAAYSFVLPMQSGAALAGAPEAELRHLEKIGRHVGIAFQLQDDLLGIFGDSEKTGKSNRSDIIEKKRTLLIRHTLEHASPERAGRLKALYAKKEALTDQEADEVIGIIEGTGARAAVEALVERHTQSALDTVDLLSINETDKTSLARLITSLVGRHA